MLVRQSDFTADLAERVVRHSSGVVVWFYEYPTPEAWLASDDAHLRNPDLFAGDSIDLRPGQRNGAS